jgi:hypothetical protein
MLDLAAEVRVDVVQTGEFVDGQVEAGQLRQQDLVSVL